MSGRIYYGWFILFATFLATLGWGLFFSFGVFYTPLLHEFGWSKAQTASVVSVATAVQPFGSVSMGALSERIGPRRIFVLASLLLAAGAALTASSNAIWQFYLFYGIIAGLGRAIIGTVPLTVAVTWFTNRRALAPG